MADKVPIEQRIAYGKEAARLLDDPLFNGVLNSVLKDCMTDLLKSVPGSEGGIAAHSLLLGIDKVKGSLISVKNDGIAAQKESERR